MPHGKSWEQLTQACAHSTKKSALKGGPGRSSISPPMAFIGPHPDMGTMRIMVQVRAQSRDDVDLTAVVP